MISKRLLEGGGFHFIFLLSILSSSLYPCSSALHLSREDGANHDHRRPLIANLNSNSEATNVISLPELSTGASVKSMTTTAAAVGSVSPEELEALYALYNATHGADWGWRPVFKSGPKWDFTTTSTSTPTPCKEGAVWQGLTCSCPSITNNASTDDVFYDYYSFSSSTCVITVLALRMYQLTGPLPSLTTNQLTSLQVLDLGGNSLSGPIPSLDMLNQLQYLAINDNYLTGTIPSLDSLSQLQTLDCSSNILDGPIPSLAGLTDLRVLALYSNSLYDPIPSLDSLGQLQYLELYQNHLSESIPVLNSLTRLQYLAIDANHLTGTIPSLDSLSSQLLRLSLQVNCLSGPLPLSLSSLTQLTLFWAHSNILTGLVPSLGQLSQLQQLYLSNNALTGSVPSVVNSSSLGTFQLDNNRFKGTLHGIFSSQRQINLTTIQLSSNQITGTIPQAIFQLPSLKTFALVSNCVRGPLPIEAMCNSSSLQELLLDGLHTASSCRDLLLGKLIPRLYELPRGVADLSHSLHHCLFAIPTLTALHMSGNGLVGSIPDMRSIGSNLRDLTLSYNALKGSIPHAVQTHEHWAKLDLSYNRLSGVLDDRNFTTAFETNNQSSIKLKLNRLSGLIPEMLYKAHDISILTGNMFKCDLLQKTLPENDKEDIDYSCGSNAFNIPYFAWIAAVCAILAVLFLTGSLRMRRVRKDRTLAAATAAAAAEEEAGNSNSNSSDQEDKHDSGTTATAVDDKDDDYDDETLLGWFKALTSQQAIMTYDDGEGGDEGDKHYPYEEEEDEKGHKDHHHSAYRLDHIVRLELLFAGTRRLAGRCWGYILFVLAPLYILCGLFSANTYTYRYAWTVSSSFLSGRVSAVLLLVALTFFVLILAWECSVLLTSIPAAQAKAEARASLITCRASEAEAAINARRPIWQRIVRFLPWVAILIVNFIVIGSSNLGFVWVAVYHGSRFNLFAVQFSLGVIKYVWNSSLLRSAIYWFISRVRTASEMHKPSLAQRMVTLELYLAVFNNLNIPCLIVAVVDPNCYYFFLVPPTGITATYEYTGYECNTYSCHTVPVAATSSFNPPFTYSYQCSAAFVTHYAAPFLYLCITAGVLVPLWESFIMLLYSKQFHISFPATAGATSTGVTPAATSTGIVSSVAVSSPLTDAGIIADSTNETTATKTTTREEADNSSSQKKEKRKVANTWLREVVQSITVTRLLKPVPLEPDELEHYHNNKNKNNEDGTSALEPVFDSTRYLVTLVTALGLLFTFGTLFPLLGFTIITTVYIYTYFTQFKLERFISLSKLAGMTEQLEEVDEECSTFVLPSNNVIWVLATISCWFYAFILFDTLGDAVGYRGAIWIVCVMGLLPAMLYVIEKVVVYRREAARVEEERNKRKKAHNRFAGSYNGGPHATATSASASDRGRTATAATATATGGGDGGGGDGGGDCEDMGLELGNIYRYADSESESRLSHSMA